MATARNSSRASSNARNQILQELKEDHKRVKKAYREFEKLDPEQSPEEVEALVQQVVQELQVHAALEEELLYPAARAAIEEDLLDEAEVEHESAHALMDQLMGMGAQDEKFAARFTVLCEYVLHHVKEEENEMFPQLERARGIDWEALAQQMTARRQELMGLDMSEQDEAQEPVEGRRAAAATEDETDSSEDSETEAVTEGAAPAKAGSSRRRKKGSSEPRRGGAARAAAEMPDNGVVRPGDGVTSRKI